MAVKRSLLLLVAVCVTSCGIPVDGKILDRVPSSDSRFEAVLLTKDGGATTSTACHVAVVRRSDTPGDSGTVFIADGFEEATKPTMRWSGRTLIVNAPSGLRFFRNRPAIRVEDALITIRYER
jgi:hypothetical protein